MKRHALPTPHIDYIKASTQDPTGGLSASFNNFGWLPDAVPPVNSAEVASKAALKVDF